MEGGHGVTENNMQIATAFEPHETQNQPALRPRVLFVAAAWPPFQAAESDHALREAQQLAEQGLDVHVLTTSRENVARPADLQVHAILSDWGWRNITSVLQVIWNVRPDAAFIFFLGSLYEYSTMALFLPTFIKLRSRHARIVTQFSNLGSGAPEGSSLRLRFRRLIFRSLGKFRYGALLPQSSRLLVMSRQHERRMAEIDASLSSKTDLVPPPPLVPIVSDTPQNRLKGRRRLAVSENEFLVMYFSRLYPRKGIEILLPAFKRLLDHVPNARLAMIGGFYNSESWSQQKDYPNVLEQLQKDLGIGDRITWSGEYAWNSTDASEYLRAADLVVLPFDGGVYLHNSSFAATCAHGLPAIITIPSEGLEPEIQHGKNVFAIPSEDEDALLEALKKLHDDVELRSQLRKGAATLADRWFTWESCIAAMRKGLGV